MSKELEALNYLVNLAVVGNKEKHRGKIFESEEIISQALKRNEPKVLINDETFGPLVLHCPSCKAFVGFDKSVIKNYCPDCGQKLDLE